MKWLSNFVAAIGIGKIMEKDNYEMTSEVMKKNGLILLIVIVSLLAFVVLAMTVSHMAGAGTFTVTSTNDGADADPDDGVCDIAPPTRPTGVCTLRVAIQQSNALDGLAMNQIQLVGTALYKLELGALEISESLVLKGNGAVIDAQMHN